MRSPGPWRLPCGIILANLHRPMSPAALFFILLMVAAGLGSYLVWQRVQGHALPPGTERRALDDRPTEAAGEISTEEAGSGTEQTPEIAAAPPMSERERVQAGLAKTRGGFVARLANLFRSKPKVDDDLRDEVEEVLFTADIGTKAAQHLLERVGDELDRSEVADPQAVWSVIHDATLELLDLPDEHPRPDVEPYVLLMIGVNGVGKTTTLGKLAARHIAEGKRVLLVAGDTFRAAAVEQLEVWADRVGCTLHRGADKADPSSVIYDGILRGRKEDFDVVLCDTAGRLHTRTELMDELAKVGRAATKAVAQGLPEAQRAQVQAPHDVFLALDATIGQNAVSQAQMFKEAMQFSGLVVTKLDGTAKGGVVLGICQEMKVPIRYIGIGEGIDDLREFQAQAFVDALFADHQTESA